MLTIYLQKKLDLFTNLRPGSNARALVNMHKKEVITHFPFLLSSLLVFHLPPKSLPLPIQTLNWWYNHNRKRLVVLYDLNLAMEYI
jgi:hypothetical protein